MKLLHLLLLSCSFSRVSAIAAGQLEIKMNEGLGKNNQWAFTSIAQFRDNIRTTWTDAQLVGLAAQAFEDATTAFDDLKSSVKGRKRPQAMAALAINTTVFFSSSVQGGSFLYNPNIDAQNRQNYIPGNLKTQTNCQLVQEALMACQARSTNASGHRTGASCGEPMAAVMFCKDDPQFADLRNARIVTWGFSRNPMTGEQTTGVMVPCKQEAGLDYTDQWGCSQFMSQLGLVVINDQSIQPEDRDTPKPTCVQPTFG